MKIAIVLLGVLVATATAQTCSRPSSPRSSYIIGSLEAKPHEFPWLVALMVWFDKGEDTGEKGRKGPGYTNKCAGTIINDRWILTSAHCFIYKSINKMKVRAGVHDISKKEPSVQEFDIDMSIQHSEFDPKILLNDIALARIKGRFHFDGSTVAAMSLPKPSDQNAFNQQCCVVAGWGNTTARSEPVKKVPGDMHPSDVLLKTHVPIQRLYICNAQYPGNSVTEKHLCVGGVRSMKQSCAGDAGSPLICVHNGIKVAAGIVSFGTFCTLNLPEVHTRISAFREWIDQILLSNADCTSPTCANI